MGTSRPRQRDALSSKREKLLETIPPKKEKLARLVAATAFAPECKKHKTALNLSLEQPTIRHFVVNIYHFLGKKSNKLLKRYPFRIAFRDVLR